MARAVRPAVASAPPAPAERQRGELVHRILSLVEYSEPDMEAQVRRAARRACREARIEVADGALAESIASRIRSPALGPFFQRKPGRRVLTEQEFCDKAGRLFRMDRVVVDDDRVSVLDFKTGAEQNEPYGEQLGGYARVLSGVYAGKTVEAFLVYVDHGVVRRVLWA